MAVKTRISEREYHDLVLQTPDVTLEVYDGEVRGKPGTPWDHGEVNAALSYFLQSQLDRNKLVIRVNEGRVRCSPERIYDPDIVVIPTALGEPFRDRPDTVPIFGDPLPLVVEVWSPPTGKYDVDSKIPEYMVRGDLEIWRLHPYQRTLTAWRKQADGTYVETTYREGVVQPASLPNVAIDLAALFAD